MDPVSVLSSIATVLNIADTVADQFERFRKDEPDPVVEEPHSVVAEQRGPAIIVERHGVEVDTITVQDIQRLDDASQQLIQALEQSMEQQFQLWKQVYPQRNASIDPIANAKVQMQLNATTQVMCADLEKIFQYLEDIGKYLDDHYMHVRFVCEDARQVSP